MESKRELLSATDFLEKLQEGKLDTPTPFSIVGMVKTSEAKKAIDFALGGNCSNWVTIPLELIEDVEMLRTISCKDHSHPLVTLNLKTPESVEGKIFFAILEGVKQGTERMEQRNDLPESGHRVMALNLGQDDDLVALRDLEDLEDSADLGQIYGRIVESRNTNVIASRGST
jgi:hypothetical protein